MKQFVFENDVLGADFVADEIVKIITAKPTALLCLAAGHSSLPVFERLIDATKKGSADFSHVRFVGLDEWLDVDSDCEGACGSFLTRSLFTPIGIGHHQICLFNPRTPDTAAECARVETYIAQCGGIDYILLGMGMNGHLALNEPGDSFENGAHEVKLSQTTKEIAPKYFPAGIPPLERGITLGIKNILAAKVLHLTIFGAHKKGVVQQLMNNPVSEDFPASVLKNCDHAVVVFDKAAFA
ncbi:glucosamine-6-phosphate deaminase [Oscillospiraceae bacterium PP1C4]